MKHLTLATLTALAAAILLVPAVTAHEPRESGDPHAGRPGISVHAVIPGSPAEAAGLEPGDAIVRLDGRQIGNMDDLGAVMSAHRPGDEVPLTVERDGESLELTLKFGERPDGGGVSIGVRLAVHADPSPDAEPTRGTVACLDWIEKTYRIDTVMRELKVELPGAYDQIRACVRRDAQRMSSENAIRYCL